MAQPSLKEITNYYNDFLEHLKLDHQTENSRHPKIKQVLSEIVKPRMDVLDIGCGTGITSKYIAEMGAKVTAVDISPDLIEYAKENSAHDNITYLIEDATNLNLNQRFDVIVLADVFEHIMRQYSFRMLQRLVKYNAHADTLIYLNLPDANFQTFMCEHYPGKQQIIDEAYTIDYIISLFEYCGFIPMNISIYGIDAKVQYNEYLFSTKESLSNYYKKRMELIYETKSN